MKLATTLLKKTSLYLRSLRILLLGSFIVLAAQSAAATDLFREDHPFLYIDVRMEIPHPPQRYGLGELRHVIRALSQAGYSCRTEVYPSSAQIICGEGDKRTQIDLVGDRRRHPNELLIVRVKTNGPQGTEIPVDEYPEFLSKFFNPNG